MDRNENNFSEVFIVIQMGQLNLPFATFHFVSNLREH